MKLPRALALVLLAPLASCGGSAASPTRGPGGVAVPPAAPSKVDAPLAPGPVESDEALRARVLAAFDAGDLAAVDEPLREVFRRAPQAGTRSLLDALDATTGRDAVRAHPFANVRPIRVSELPPVAPSPASPGKLVAKRKKGATAADLGDLQFPAPEYRHLSRSKVDYPPSIPGQLAGNTLLLVRPSAGRWLALYGRDRADARFVAVLRDDGTAEAVFDFAAWRAKIQIAEAGVSWAEIQGGTLYVKTEVVAFDGFIAAIDLKTGKTTWRSEQVGFASNFVVGPDKIVVWRWQPRDSILALDRATGATALRLDTPYNPARALVAAGGRVEAQGVAQLGDDEVYVLDVATTEPSPPPPALGDPAPHKRIAADPLRSPDDAERRRKAWARLDADDPLGALVLVRDVLERNPGNFAANVLYAAADAALTAAREQAGKLTVPVIRPDATKPPLGRAPIARAPQPPRVRLVEEREYRRPATAWFPENDVPPNQFSRDVAPSQFAVHPAPAWFADTLLGEARTQDVSAPDHAVGVYGFRYVAVYRDGKLGAVLDCGGDAPKGGRRVNVMFADVVGDVALVGVFSDKPALLAIDVKTGALLWRAAGLQPGSFVIVDGYVVAANGSADVVVVEGDTGRVVSRVKTPKAYPMSYRLARKDRTIYGFDTVMTSRFALE